MKKIALLSILLFASVGTFAKCELNIEGQTICEKTYGIVEEENIIHKIKIKKFYRNGFSKVKFIEEGTTEQVPLTSIIGEETCTPGEKLCVSNDVVLTNRCNLDLPDDDSYHVDNIYGREKGQIMVEIRKNRWNKAIVDLECVRKK